MKIIHKSYWMAGVSILLASSLLTGCSFFFPVEEESLKPPTIVEPTEIEYATTTVKRDSIEETYEGICEVASKTQYSLRFKDRSGRLSIVNNLMGSEVKKGDIIAQVNVEDIKYDLELARIDLEALQKALDETVKETDKTLAYDIEIARLKVVETKFEYDQWNDVLPDDDTRVITTKLAYEKATVAYHQLLDQLSTGNDEVYQAQVALQKQQLAVDRLEKEITDSTLRAPVTGEIIAATNLKVGDPVTPETEIATIADTSSLLIATTDQSSHLRNNLPTVINFEGKAYPVELRSNLQKGGIYQIGVDGQQIPYTFLMTPKEPIPDLVYDQGFLFTVTVQHKDDALVVPSTCVQQMDSDAPFVSVLKDDIKLDIPVKIGIKNAAYVEIEEGLEENDVVIYTR